jgi:Beta-lactamase
MVCDSLAFAFTVELCLNHLLLSAIVGKTLYSNARGKLNFESESAPFTTDSVCWIASMTKLVTAVSVMQLVEKGMIGLNDDLGKLIPQFSNIEVLKGFDDDGNPIMEKKAKPITLRYWLRARLVKLVLIKGQASLDTFQWARLRRNGP